MTRDEGLEQYYAARVREYDQIYAKPERQSDLAELREMVASSAKGRAVLSGLAEPPQDDAAHDEHGDAQ